MTTTMRDLAKRAYYSVPAPINPLFAPRQHRTRRQLRTGQATRLHLGCGHRRFDGYVNIDMKITRATDYVGDISHLPCPDGTVERIETYHVIEHIPHPHALQVVTEWCRALKPGGTLVVECPDFDEGIRQYLSGDERMLGSIYGWQRYEGDTHYYGYNVERLSALLLSAGFAQVLEGEPTDYHKDTEPCLRVEAVKAGTLTS
jgi:predicted SAM-dependent methyltransferase